MPDDAIIKLLRNPNWFQAEKEFMRQTKLFHEIFGNEYLYAFFGVGSEPSKSKALYTLPPNGMKVTYDQSKEPFFLTTERPDTVKYVYRSDNVDYPIANEQIVHLNDNRVNVTDEKKKDFLKGESKQEGLKPALNNLRMAYETRGVILKRRGGLGILSNAGADVSGQIPLEKIERDRLQKDYSQYGGLEGQDNLIITNANLKWQQMSVSPDKLGLFTETEEDFYKICDAYGTPMELFASKKGVTYENQNEARKSFYDNTVMPEANEWAGSLSSFFYGKESPVQIVIDYSDLSIFQEDLELQARGIGALISALSQAFTDGALSIGQYQAELNKLGLGVGNVK